MRSAVLRRFAAGVGRGEAGARPSLEATLGAAAGPLVEPLPDGGGRVLVTFVVTGRRDPPVVASQLFGGVDGEQPMAPVPGTDDVWWAEAEAAPDVETVYQFHERSAPELPAELASDEAALVAYLRDVYESGFSDPRNPRRCYPTAALMSLGAGAGAPPVEKWQSVLSLPEAPPYPWHAEPPQHGSLEERVVESRLLGNRRIVTLWRPPADGGELPVVVLLDGECFLLGMDAPRIFDNLAAKGHARPFAAALVHNATPSSRVTEYPCHPRFPAFLADELLPALGLAGREAVVGGYSYGGLAACWAAHVRPDVFGSVLALSPSLWWGPPGEPAWLLRRLAAAAPAAPVRFWIEVGSLEGATLPRTDGLTMLSVARQLRDVVLERGHSLAGYRERPGGHDVVNWRRGLPAGLAALLGPAPAGGA